MVRWDSPLFTVPWSESDVPIELIWKAITEGNVKPPNAGTQAVGDLFVSSNPYSFRLGAESTF
jgi:tRNA uridine 5-carbamoylmethylation protein Kti12